MECGWKVAGLRADNTPGYESVAMNMSADYAVFYSPDDGGTARVIGAALTQQVTISSPGPSPEGRDQSAPFAAGDVIWFYYIWGQGTGVSTTSSKTGPTAVNANGTTGPIFPTGYTHYAPAFPIKLYGSATLNPVSPLAGPQLYQIRGNTVRFANNPLIDDDHSYPVMNFSVADWIPTDALLCNFYIDAEIHSYAGGGVIGGAIGGTPQGNFVNISLYPSGPSVWAAQDVWVSAVLPNLSFSLTFETSAGVVDQAFGGIFICGYTFSNG